MGWFFVTLGSIKTIRHTQPILCPHWDSADTVKNGHRDKGDQRWRCKRQRCQKSFQPAYRYNANSTGYGYLLRKRLCLLKSVGEQWLSSRCHARPDGAPPDLQSGRFAARCYRLAFVTQTSSYADRVANAKWCNTDCKSVIAREVWYELKGLNLVLFRLFFIYIVVHRLFR